MGNERRAKVDGEKIKSILKERGWSQSLFAEKTGIEQTYVSRIVRGVSDPTLVQLKMMAMVLGKSEEELRWKEPVYEEPKAESTVQTTLAINDIMRALDVIVQRIDRLQKDQEEIASYLQRIEKAVMETKAQTGINAESLQVIDSRSFDISSGVSKLVADRQTHKPYTVKRG